MKIDAEVLVLGGGTAGAAAALTLARRGRRVALVEQSRSRRIFGEILPPGALTHLAALDCSRVLKNRRHRAAWSQRSAWGSALLSIQDFTFHPNGCAWHLDREAFDADLLACARDAGVSYFPGVIFRRASRRTGGGWHVALREHGTVTAAFIVDATGRASALGRQLGHNRYRMDRLVALVALVDMDAIAEPDLLIETGPCGWWYLAPLSHRRAVAALLTDANIVPAGQATQAQFWSQELLRTVHVRARLRLSGAVEVRAAPAGTERLSRSYENGWVAVGDAVASFDPLSSMGLAHALDTGRLAALAVDAALAGEQRLLASYARVVQKRIDECDLLRRSYYATERRWPTAHFWAAKVRQ